MYDVIGGFNDLRRQISRRRADQSLRRLRKDVDSLRRDLNGVRTDASRGVFVKEVRRLAGNVSDSMPTMRRKRGPNTVAMSAPVVAVMGMAGLAVLLLWDDRRRAAMRRRLDDVASTVSSNLNRATDRSPVPTGRS